MDFIFDNERPIYKQLIETLERLIIIGALEPGSKILSVRDFSLATKVNPNTMQRALNELEEKGLIYTKRTSGKFVTEDKVLIAKIKENIAKNKAEQYLIDMQELGFSKEEAIIYTDKGGK